MRKFVISDIHGLGSVYYPVMNYLDNISKNEEIELYINGDLIDRGKDSALILLDIVKRIKENNYKIIYLGGNHELAMYQVYYNVFNEMYVSYDNDWYRNGGKVTDEGLNNILKDENDKVELVNFIGNLKIYHKFYEKINDKNIVLVHAMCPLIVKDECDLKIKDDNYYVYDYVWTREYDPFIGFRCRIGNNDYFSIVGHTPNNNKYGYVYNKHENYLNIDGGCALYACGYENINHVPLVEIQNDYLKILTFNNNNEIIYGNYFDGKRREKFTSEELNKERKLIL